MRCQSEKDCCANINAVVDQTKSDQEMENRIENEQNNKRYCGIRDHFWWKEEVICIKY